MKRFAVGAAILALLIAYFAVVLWLVLSGSLENMLAGALLAAAPIVVGVYESLRSASVERARILEELRELREEIRRGNG